MSFLDELDAEEYAEGHEEYAPGHVAEVTDIRRDADDKILVRCTEPICNWEMWGKP